MPVAIPLHRHRADCVTCAAVAYGWTEMTPVAPVLAAENECDTNGYLPASGIVNTSVA